MRRRMHAIDGTVRRARSGLKVQSWKQDEPLASALPSMKVRVPIRFRKALRFSSGLCSTAGFMAQAPRRASLAERAGETAGLWLEEVGFRALGGEPKLRQCPMTFSAVRFTSA